MLNIGDLLENKYRIMELVGRGAWGNVYLAENIKIGNKWAVKEIALKNNTGVNLLAEPEILKKINHRSLPRIVDIVKNEDFLYIIEDYFEGVSLKEFLKSREFCAEGNVIDWGIQLCEILLYLHNIKPNPIIYRDMKPGNIIIDAENNLKLVDFGTAREYKHGKDSDSTFIGTRGYAAPEQFAIGGQSDERTDVYGLGATLYHIITGIGPNEPPYELVPVRQINKSLSKEIEKIISKCVQNDPELRYQNVSELLNDLISIKVRGKVSRFENFLHNFTGKLQAKLQGKTVVEKILGTVVIAVGGTSRGVGSTYTAIAIASFLTGQKYKVAAIELCESPVFFALEDEDSSIDFYHPNSNLVNVLRAGYDYVILDLGTLKKCDSDSSIKKNPWYDEMNRSDFSILVAGSALWQLKDLGPFIENTDTDNWHLVLRTPERSLFNELKEELNYPLYAMPFSPNPFEINEEQKKFLEVLLKPVLPKETTKNGLLFWK